MIITTDTDIGAWLRKRRMELGLKQKEAAKMAGITAPGLCHVENGTVRPFMETLLLLGKALDFEIEIREKCR